MAFSSDSGILRPKEAAFANPYGMVAAYLGNLYDKQDERARQAAADARAQEQLDLQKADHQMKVDAVAQAVKEKEAANKYADVLNAAVSGNVVGMQDQKALGERIALLGSQAETAGKAGDVATQNKLIAEQNKYIDSSVPKMVKAYEESPDAQLQVLRASNPLGGTKGMAPQTRLALLKEAEAPIEKASDRIKSFADQKALLKMQAEYQEAADKRREVREEKLWKAREDYQDKKTAAATTAANAKEKRKQEDAAMSDLMAIGARLETLEKSDPENKDIPMLKQELANGMTMINKGLPTGKKDVNGNEVYLPTSIEAVSKFTKELDDRVKTLGTYKHEADKQADKEFKELLDKVPKALSESEWFTDNVEYDSVLDVATKDLSDSSDRAAIKARYGNGATGMIQLLQDVKKKAPDKLAAFRDALNTENLDSFGPWGSASVESKLKDIMKDPILIDTLTGKKLKRNSREEQLDLYLSKE